MSASKDQGGDFKGYRSPTLELLQREQAPVWSQVTLHTSRGDFSGLILPRSETADALHVVLKLATGYNIGVRWDTVESIAVHGRKEAHYQIPEKAFPYDPAKPRVKLFGTGGTIASRLDYRTGAVIPAFSPGELYGSVPELADVCNMETEKLYGVFSENMGPEQWMGTARAIAAEIAKGVQGIVVGHGTDTMHHTAAALSFMVQDSPVPIVMVGSQRSSDRPSSDAAINLINATRTAATSDIAEVMVCMFGPTSDQLRPAAPGHPGAQDALVLPLDLPHPERHPPGQGRPGRRDPVPRGLQAAAGRPGGHPERRLRRPGLAGLLLPRHEAGHHRLPRRATATRAS